MFENIKFRNRKKITKFVFASKWNRSASNLKEFFFNYCLGLFCLFILSVVNVKVLVAQSCLTLFNPVDCSPPGSSLQGIFQQEYWNGLPFLSPGDIPDPGIETTYPALVGGCFNTLSHMGGSIQI